MHHAHTPGTVPDTSAATTWRQADDAVHVAHRDGQYAGFVEQTRAGWRAHGATGAALGAHATSAAAQAAVEADAPMLPRTPRRIDATAAKTLVTGAGTAHATTRALPDPTPPVTALVEVTPPVVRRQASPRTRAQRRPPRTGTATPTDRRATSPR